MTPNPTARQAQALQALKMNQDLVDVLTSALEDRKAKLVYLRNPDDVYVCQGQAQAYKELLDTILGNSPARSGKRP